MLSEENFIPLLERAKWKEAVLKPEALKPYFGWAMGFLFKIEINMQS